MKIGNATRRLSWVVVLAAAGLLFAPSLRFPFIWDDTAVVRDNPYLHSPAPVGLFFTPHYWQRLLPVSRFDYRPLQMVTLAAISRAGGQNPLYYRIANLALHLLCAGLVFKLAGRLGAGKIAALLAAAFFALHPVHVETVACARNISELAAAALLLAALLLNQSNSAPGGRTLSLLLFATALLYKESALIFPLILTIFLLVPKESGTGRSVLRQTIPFWLLAAAAAGMGKIFLASRTAGAGLPTLLHLPGGAARLLLTDLRLLLFPARLQVLYHFPRPESWAEPGWLVSLAVVILLAGLLVPARKDRRLLTILLALSASLLPSLSLVGQPGRMVAEQRLYLPSVFFCLAAAVLIERTAASGSGQRRKGLWVLGFLIGLLWAGLAGDYLRDWQNELSLWKRVTAANPRAAVAFNNLAIALSRQGETEKARAELERAMEIDPSLPEAHSNLGILDGRAGRWEQATAAFRRALRADPSHHPASLFLAQAYLRLGREEEAAGVLRGVLEQNPDHAEAANELGIVLEKLGQFEEAAVLYRDAADLNPRYAAPLRNLAALFQARGDFDRALAAGQEAVARCPDQPRGYVVLADINISRGRLEEARALLQEGARLDPGNWKIKSRLLALKSAGAE